jgi:hypothetical protein
VNAAKAANRQARTAAAILTVRRRGVPITVIVLLVVVGVATKH